MIVADTNLLVHLLLPTPETPTAERVYEKDGVWFMPRLWRSEFRNVMSVQVRAGRITLDNAFATMKQGIAILQRREAELPSRLVLRLAVESGCSAYDCEFVALAEIKSARLVTSDRKVLRAFPQIAVSPADFVA